MRTILTIILVLYIHTTCVAQRPQWTIVPLEERAGTTHYIYFKDINHSLDKFVGTWVYNQSNESFKITFIKKENLPSRINLFQKEDRVLTRYEYKKNGSVVFETYTTNISRVNFVLLKDSNTMVLVYTEPSFTHCRKNRIGDLLVTYSLNSNNQPTLTWVRTDDPVLERPFPCKGSTTVDITDFVAPPNMVLTKE